MEQTWSRSGLDELPAHLEAAYGAPVAGMREPDVGVYRVGRRGGSTAVSRMGARAAVALLDAARPRFPPETWPLHATLSAELAATGRWDGLPHALVHPDFVPANAITARDGTIVLVDWTGALCVGYRGHGPRAAGRGGRGLPVTRAAATAVAATARGALGGSG